LAMWGEGKDCALCFCIRNAFAAWVYRSAAFSYFSVLPPNKLNPPPAPAIALSACGVYQLYGSGMEG
jgi:hypothetical protein